MEAKALRQLRSEQPLEALAEAVATLEAAQSGNAQALELAEAVWLDHFVGLYSDDKPGAPALLVWDAVRHVIKDCRTRQVATDKKWWGMLERAESACKAYLTVFYERLHAGSKLHTFPAGHLLSAAFALARAASLWATQPQGLPAAEVQKQLTQAMADYATFWQGEAIGLRLGTTFSPSTLSESPIEAAERYLACHVAAMKPHEQSLQIGRAMVRYALRWLLNVPQDLNDVRQTIVLFAAEGGSFGYGTSGVLEVKPQRWGQPGGAFFVNPVFLGMTLLDDTWRLSFDRAYRAAKSLVPADEWNDTGDVAWRIIFSESELRRPGDVDLRQPLVGGPSASGAAAVSLAMLWTHRPMRIEVCLTAEVDENGNLHDVGGKFAKLGGQWAGATELSLLHFVLIGKPEQSEVSDLVWDALVKKANLRLDYVETVEGAIELMSAATPCQIDSPICLTTVQKIAKRRMWLDHFRSFAGTVCQHMQELTGCAFQVWDPNGRGITKRFKPHQICEWFYESLPVGERCSQDDKKAVERVLRTCKAFQYDCWAGFTCFMVPIELNSTAVGVISTGEFFLTDDSLTSAGRRACDQMGYDAEMRLELKKVRRLNVDQVASLKRTVRFLAGIIADMLADRLHEMNCDEYFESLVKRAEEDLSQNRYGILLAPRIIWSAYGSFMSQVMSVSQWEQELKLNHFLSPLHDLTSLLEGLPDEPNREHAHALIQECSTRVRTSLTRSDGIGGLWLEGARKVPVKLAECAEQVIEEFRAQLRPGEIKISISSRIELVAIRSHLEWILRNLVDNAIKSSESPRLISISAEDCGDELVVRVSHNGRGMTMAEWECIIQGLGPCDGKELRVVKELAERNWGDMERESIDEQGSTIKITFTRLRTKRA